MADADNAAEEWLEALAKSKQSQSADLDKVVLSLDQASPVMVSEENSDQRYSLTRMKQSD